MLLMIPATVAQAQRGIQFVPIQPFQSGADRTKTSPLNAVSTRQASSRTAALGLPFFDDFSTSPNGPDPALWQAGSGVYINNTLPIGHPSVNVATFDGLNANGSPYVFTVGTTGLQATGPTDTLTSLPIDLSPYTPADSVYLSFYWERRGLGELPDGEDSLRLQFYGADTTWHTIWMQTGGTTDSLFTQAFIPVSAAFLKANFQFKFQSFGRQSGMFDQWHVDYIYLNRGRSQTDRYIKDVACRRAVSPYLKRYTAMPLRQYLVNPAAETADSITTDINNLFNNFNFTTYHFTVQDQVSGQIVQDEQQTLSTLIPSLSSQLKSQKPTPMTTVAGGATNRRVVLRSKFDILTTDDQNPSIPTINLRRNDTISGLTVLDNYYAYDDGTAEVAVQINQQEAQVAVRFMASQLDTLSGVRMCIVPAKTNLTGQTFALSVYNNDRGRPGRSLYQQSFAVAYPSQRNGFVDFTFANGVPVTDTFYVSFTQIASDFVGIGFDRNSPFTNQTLLNLGPKWEVPDNSSTRGALMIRPVVGGTAKPVITAIDQEPSSVLQVYPNPTAGSLTWDNPKLIRLDVYDVAGRLVHSVTADKGRQTTSLTHLADGLYILHLFDGERTVTQKIIVRK